MTNGEEDQKQVYFDYQQYIQGNSKYNRFVIRGCIYYKEVWDFDAPNWPYFSFSLQSPFTPMSAGTTDDFEFNLYRDFEQALDYQLTGLMLSGTVSIPGSRFISGALTNGLFESKVEFIQTSNIITLTFRMSNSLPAYESGN